MPRGENAKTEDDEEPYDPFRHREIKHGNGDLAAMMHLIKTSIGAGILSMPKAFSHAGLWLGFVGTLIMGGLCIHCAYIIASVSRKQCKRSRVPVLNFGDTAKHTFLNAPGKLHLYANAAKIFVNISIWCMYYGLCSVYVVYIGNQTKQLCECKLQENHEALKPVAVYILYYVPVFFLLGQFRYLQHIIPLSTLGNVFYLIGFATIFYFVFRTPMPPLSSRIAVGDIMSIPSFMTIVIFSMENVGVIMPVENTLKHPKNFLGCGVLMISMTATTFFYAIMGFIGYWKYGDETADSITLNSPPEEAMALLLKSSVLIAILMGYALCFFIPTSIIWELMEPNLLSKFTTVKTFIIGVLVRFFLALCTVVAGISIPKISAIMGIVGAVFFSTTGIMCPVVLEIITYWTETGALGIFRKVKNGLILCVYLLVLTVGTYEAVLDLMSLDRRQTACMEPGENSTSTSTTAAP